MEKLRSDLPFTAATHSHIKLNGEWQRAQGDEDKSKRNIELQTKMLISSVLIKIHYGECKRIEWTSTALFVPCNFFLYFFSHLFQLACILHLNTDKTMLMPYMHMIEPFFLRANILYECALDFFFHSAFCSTQNDDT